MNTYDSPELILSPEGKIYHLDLKPGQVAENIILVGDPHRVNQVSRYFDAVELENQNREILTHTGNYDGKKVTVMSTGMGTDNIDIVMHELDALFNVDFDTGKRKIKHTSLNIFRIGTSGAIQPDIPVNAFIVAEYGVGLDGLMHYYEDTDSLLEYSMAEQFVDQTGWPSFLPRPYAVKASEELLKLAGEKFVKGITITSPGFYGPQGRMIRLKLTFPDLVERIMRFNYNGKKITNFEMETSALYGLSKFLGHRALTVCAAIANRITGEHNTAYKQKMDELIRMFLVRIVKQL